MSARVTRATSSTQWSYVYFDGSALPSPGAGRAGFVIDTPDGETEEGNVQMRAEFTGTHGEWMGGGPRDDVTNHEAAYVALMCGIHAALKARIRDIVVRGNSALVIKQCGGGSDSGEFECMSNPFNIWASPTGATEGLC